MRPDLPERLRAVVTNPVARLLADLPPQWQGEVLGPGIDGWAARIDSGRHRRLNMRGVPERLRVELAWMAHWQYRDGAHVGVTGYRLIAVVLAWAAQNHWRVPESLATVDPAELTRLFARCFQARNGRLPAADGYNRMTTVLGYPRLALMARLNDGPWWALDTWHPRCDPRIPQREREPLGYEGCSPGRAQTPWLREAIKWHLATLLESGTLVWSTIVGRRVLALTRFDRWLATLDDPTAVLRDADRAGALAAAFRQWTSEPDNRSAGATNKSSKATPRLLNSDLLAVAELMRFMLDNREEARMLLGSSPWDQLTEAHPAAWSRLISRERNQPPPVQEDHYVDDHALAQITACLPALGLAEGEILTVTLNGQDRTLPGRGDPQAMRMLLLQILTGRRASEISLCDFDCLSAPTDRALEAAEGEQVARFRYGQSKIDRAPDTILVDAEVVAVIEEQKRWIADNFPDVQPRYLFLQRRANAYGTKSYGRGNYGRVLRGFSETAQICDSQGCLVRLSHTHRFRHTKLTRLAELGLPVHVLQRYAGHANPTMAMHYVARREEHAEQAFLATRKFKADGTAITFSREDHDGMHLFNRADRFLPNGWCLLPPLQRCDKGNACLTCGVFVTDDSHLNSLTRQLSETTALIERTTSQFEVRHGRPMPDDNVWLVERRAESDALRRLLDAMRAVPGRAIQGAGSPTSGPTPVVIDLTRHRKSTP